MLFIKTDRANVSQPINLHHVVTFRKGCAGSTTMIVFEASSGETICWKYYKNKTNRDLDYEQLMKVTGISEQEGNPSAAL